MRPARGRARQTRRPNANRSVHRTAPGNSAASEPHNAFHFGLRTAQGGLRFHLVLHFFVKRFGDALEFFNLFDLGSRKKSARLWLVRLKLNANMKQIRKRHAQNERAQHQFRLDVRAFALLLAFDVKLDAFAEENPRERHDQQKNQCEDGPENNYLIEVGRPERAGVEGALPHHGDH